VDSIPKIERHTTHLCGLGSQTRMGCWSVSR